MTLEQTIERYENLARACEEKIEPGKYASNERYKRCAEEYRQLAEWLKELKKLKAYEEERNYDICLGGFHGD